MTIERKNVIIFAVGTLCTSIWSMAQHYVDRSGRATDVSDFALGLLFGVGIGMMLLGVWRIAQARRPTTS